MSNNQPNPERLPRSVIVGLRIFLPAVLLLWLSSASAQLAVTVSPVKATGQKAVVPLAMKNNFGERVESARAVCFLMDEQGRTIAPPTTRWVIGGNDTNGLAVDATSSFHFVVTSNQPFTTTNLTANVQFSRVVLQGGRLADVTREVQVTTAENH